MVVPYELSKFTSFMKLHGAMLDHCVKLSIEDFLHFCRANRLTPWYQTEPLANGYHDLHRITFGVAFHGWSVLAEGEGSRNTRANGSLGELLHLGTETGNVVHEFLTRKLGANPAH